MDFFFEPKGVAIVGATPGPYSGGRHLVANLTLGYKGPIYPINPKYGEILGLKCYANVREVEGPLDLALIFVPAQVVPQVLEDCVAKGVRGAILESSGFAEVGPEGKALQDQCLAIGKGRIAILSYSGASGIVTTDHMIANGLTLARLSPKTLKRLEEFSPSWMPVKNPVDYWPAMEKYGPAVAYKNGIEALHEDPGVDGLIVHLFAGFGIWFLDMKEIMSGIREPRKPILFWLMGPEKGREPTRMALEAEGWPTFHEIHRTVKVMACLFERTTETKKSEIPSIEFRITDSLRELAHRVDEQGTRILDEHEAKKWFKVLDLNIVKEVVVKDLEETIRAAEEMGYPVVLKGRAEGKIHKTEIGLVKLNLWSTSQVRSAFQEMLCLSPRPRSFLIQPMLKGDLELIVGTVRDPQFGPAVILGLGGIHAEVYKDVVFRLPPLNQDDVLEMVSGLKGQDLLKGYRGSKSVNIKSLTDWLIKLGWLALTFEKIQEIDVNPLLIVDGEPIAVDATIIFV